MAISATEDEVMAFFTEIMRGGGETARAPTTGERIKAAENLMKIFASEEKRLSSLEKLDQLLEEFRNAVDAKAV